MNRGMNRGMNCDAHESDAAGLFRVVGAIEGAG